MYETVFGSAEGLDFTGIFMALDDWYWDGVVEEE
jgi:hypothetical protein